MRANCAHFEDALLAPEEPTIIAVDIMIGLPDTSAPGLTLIDTGTFDTEGSNHRALMTPARGNTGKEKVIRCSKMGRTPAHLAGVTDGVPLKRQAHFVAPHRLRDRLSDPPSIERLRP